MKLYKMITRLSDEINQDIEVEKLDDKKSLDKYGVKNIPGLVINDKLVSQGKVLTTREISKYIA